MKLEWPGSAYGYDVVQPRTVTADHQKTNQDFNTRPYYSTYKHEHGNEAASHWLNRTIVALYIYGPRQVAGSVEIP